MKLPPKHQSNQSGRKQKASSHLEQINHNAAGIDLGGGELTQSRSALGAFYRRLRSRLGAPKAITATAHKLARIFYRMWTTAELYTDPGMDYYEQKYQDLMLKNLQKKADAFGLQLVPKPEEQPEPRFSQTLAT